MQVEQKIREYVLENYLFTDDSSALDSAASFMESGILDSTGILEIIYFIEDEFGISIEDDEMIPENLDSVNNTVAFINKKNAAGN
ncbi:MAG: acyl carrier protein [Gammaproteobacteria bacterium]|nr:acyl carrier protein [Gammaproteobacteria bacterium]